MFELPELRCPDTVSILAAARQAWLDEQFDQALDLFRQAHHSAPSDLRLAIETASYLGMRFEVAEALEVLKHCESSAAGNPAALHQLGLAYGRAYRSNDALRCFEAASELGSEPARLQVAQWHERRGDLQRAEEALEQCTTDSLDATLWRGRMAARRGDDEAARNHFERLASGTGGNAEQTIAAFYELAALYDRRDDADSAVNAAQQAKRLQMPQVKAHLAVAKSLAAIEQNFVSTSSQVLFEKWQEQSSHRPVALLTGPPRSGTSLMIRMLGMHPKLAVADEMEAYSTYLQPRMLAGKSGTNAADILDSLEPDHLDNCRATYFRWLDDAIDCEQDDHVLFDKFPSTTFLIPPFRRLFPNATIIMALRDPRDVVVSCFLRHFELNPVSSMFARLDWAVARCCAEWKAWLILRDRLTQPWVEVRYEDIVTENYAGCEAALEAMGLAWQDDFADFHNTLRSNPARSPSYAQLREQVTSQRTERWKLYRAFLQPQLERLNQFASALGY